MIIVLLLLILINALFALSEMALVNTRKTRLQKYIDHGDKKAIAALQLAENPADFMSAIQIAITAISLINGLVGNIVLTEPLSNMLQSFGIPEHIAHPSALVLAFVLVTYVSIVIGELVPKRLGQLAPEAVARFMARPMMLFSQITHPLVKFLSYSTNTVLRLMKVRYNEGPLMTEDEIHALIAESTQTGIIDEQEHQMVKNVFRLDDRSIGSFMVPKADVIWLSLHQSTNEIIEILQQTTHHRFALCRDSINDVIGIINAKDILHCILKNQHTTPDLTALCSKPLFVNESFSGLELLNAFREAKYNLALVVDEYGDIQGLVTMHDLMETITGQMDISPSAEDALAVQKSDGSWLLDGLISTTELRDTLQLKILPDEDRATYHTLSGMIMLLLGRIPQILDAVEWHHWKFEIVDMDGHRIDKVHVYPITDKK